MSDNGKIFRILLVLMACAFGFGVYTILNERFERGDAYPPYSSFRSDPGGTKAFYLALDRLTGMKVRRNFLDPSRLLHEKGSTFFFLGVKAGAMRAISKKDIESLELLARKGNRLVFAFSPISGSKEGGTGGKEEGGGDTKKSDVQTENPGGSAPCWCLAWRWNVILNDTLPEKGSRRKGGSAVPAPGEKGLPESLPVHSSLSFRPDDGFWRTVYSLGGDAVLIERRMGTGSIVFLSESYPTLNGAMRDQRYPALLLRLLGGNKTAVFDETHLGVAENPGIMSLVEKYRLTYFLVALLLLACLYLWKNSVPLVPSRALERSGDDGVTTDKDAVGGLISLLRRNIPAADLLDVCFREWMKSFSREYREGDGTRERLRAIVDQEMSKPPAKRDPAAGYRGMARILAERK
jgi:hypothetical protein